MEMVKIKRISLGTTDFKEIIEKDLYYIDKTLIIKEFLEDSGKIVLLPRPRRFGKTLNLSTIRYFLEKSNEDRSILFKGLDIEKEEEIMKELGKYPLIYLTFKDEKHSSFEKFKENLKIHISDLYKKYYYLYSELKFEDDRKYYDSIINRSASQGELEISLYKLSEFLNQYYNQKVIILIDEYDTPIHESYFRKYYEEMIEFIRNFLSAALKDNINLEKAMLTGILRVGKESIFSGLNNLEVYSILDQRYSKMFGFTEKEIHNLLVDFDLKENLGDVKKWYDGYIFGKETIYNPWSVLTYANKSDRGFAPYWVNTSENSIIKEILADGDEEVKIDLENLCKDIPIETYINEDITMSEISIDKDNIWSFLLVSGYLKTVGRTFDEDRNLYLYKLKIPNIEISILYKNIIEKWFKESFVDSEFKKMLKALIEGDIDNFAKIFKRYVLSSFSYFDVNGKNPEKVYHAFVLGLLVSLSKTHEVVSNRESGIGRYDVSLIPKDTKKHGIIFEFKRYDKEDAESLDEVLIGALQQIEDKKYDTELRNRGIKNIIKLAIVFSGKDVYIRENR